MHLQRRLGHALFTLADLGDKGHWFEIGTKTLSELGMALDPVLERAERDIKSLLTQQLRASSLEEAKRSATLFSIVDKNPSAFSVRSRVVSMRARLIQSFEIGLDRLFDKCWLVWISRTRCLKTITLSL